MLDNLSCNTDTNQVTCRTNVQLCPSRTRSAHWKGSKQKALHKEEQQHWTQRSRQESGDQQHRARHQELATVGTHYHPSARASEGRGRRGLRKPNEKVRWEGGATQSWNPSDQL